MQGHDETVSPDAGIPAALPEVLYTRDRLQRLGARAWGEIVRDLGRSRQLVWRLFIRNWSAQYRQSWLGYLWAVVPPLVAATFFAYAVRHRYLNIGTTEIPYVCYAIWGMTVWQFFTGIYVEAATSLTSAGQMIARINFPKDALVFASLGQSLFTFAVRLAAVAAVFALNGFLPARSALLAPLSLFPLVLMGLGLGMIMAVMSAAGNDVHRAVGVLLNFGMLLTPVIYPPPATWPAAAVNVLNPISPVLAASHALIQGRPLADPMLYLMSWGCALLVFAVGWRIFRLALPRIAERF